MLKKRMIIVMNPHTYDITVCESYKALAHFLYGLPDDETDELYRASERLRKKINNIYGKQVRVPFIIIDGYHIWKKLNFVNDKQILRKDSYVTKYVQ